MRRSGRRDDPTRWKSSMGSPPVHHTTKYEDDRRARELFHYFQPDNPALLPAGPRDAGSTNPPSSPTKASPNLVLTALTQLAAIKLGVQRAIISLIDRETLYVVAEASKSLNLGNNEIYADDGDGLWMGCSHGPVAGTLCEKTITLKPTPEERYPLFVVDDLRQHPIYNNIPCVCGPPFFRYYAGTPLTTSNGITIGSLYVIDPRPDITLTPSHVESLGTIADAVMEYLETSRQSLESHRLAKVLSGLNSFVQGDDGEDSPIAAVKHDSLSDRASSHVSSPQESPKMEAHNFNLHATSDTSSMRSTSPEHNADVTDIMLDRPHSPKSSNPEVSVPLSAKRRAKKTRSTFQRAANLMRESLDLGQEGGVLILDSSEHLESDIPDDLDRDKERKLASVCALSTKGSFEDPSTSSHSPITPQLDLYFVRRMVRRYPRGGLWYFYQDGTAFSSDDDAVSSGSEIAVSNSTTRSQQSVHPQSFGTLREKDLQTLRKCFPRATRIVFAPLWDSFNSRWFGGCFGWSAVETRVFSAHVELGGVFGFGSSLMVEHSRAQSQESDKKKGDFISSISHELRSPLHGILAATDFLSEHVDSKFAKSLLDTVRACGRTLLDTFEQILDYSKINSLDMKRQLYSSRVRERGRYEKSRIESLRLLKVVHVAAVIEDVIESVYSGHIFSNTLASGVWQLEPGDEHNQSSDGCNISPIDILIDVAPHHWEFMIEPGALRRIVMNVFGNALKYTREGSVSVRVDLQKRSAGADSTSSDNSEPEVLVLTVSDTGKGISSEYLHSNIFTPFSQEDTLSPGTGLGLSLVRNILRSLNGTIKIKSQVGAGTVVKISLPLTRPQRRETPSPTSFPSSNFLLRGSSDVVERLKTEMRWKTLSLLPGGENHDPCSLHIIRDYLTDWFALRLQNWDSAVPSDLILVRETDLERLPKTLGQSLVLVLCQRGPGLRSIRDGASGLASRLIQITLPCGPYRLARTLMEAIESGNRETTPTLNQLSRDLSQVVLHESNRQQDTQPTSRIRAPHISEKVEPSVSKLYSLTLTHVSNSVQGSEIAVKKGPETGIRILLVEDNPINMALLKKFVNRKLPQVLHTAVNGKIAVERVQQTTEGYHYIFMDMSMPVMDGFEATQAIRSIERNRGTTHPATIIALTGLGSSEHLAKAFAAGINVFLTKPFSFNDIARLMDERNIHAN